LTRADRITVRKEKVPVAAQQVLNVVFGDGECNSPEKTDTGFSVFLVFG
jgi:hypothetical protein